MRCSDGHFYVVKFRNNPQHPRIPANELLASRLAAELGLPVPASQIVQVESWLIEHTPELHVQLANTTIRCEPGQQFGSQYAVNPLLGQIFDYLPSSMLAGVRNLDAFAGMLAFDKWTGNTDLRQAVFWRKVKERKYTAAFIDQGHCFNAGTWTFSDDPFRGAFPRNEVYATVNGWQSFEPWLSRIEQVESETIRNIAKSIPRDWYGSDFEHLEKLIATLVARRVIVRDLIGAFRFSPLNPFPGWHSHKSAMVRI